MQSIVANLTPALECQDHTTSPSAESIDRLAMLPRPPHPAPRFVTIRAYAPYRDRTAGTERLIWGFLQANYFSGQDWTTQISLNPLVKFVCWSNNNQGGCSSGGTIPPALFMLYDWS